MALRVVTKEQREIKNIPSDKFDELNKSFEYAKDKKSKVSPYVHKKKFSKNLALIIQQRNKDK